MNIVSNTQQIIKKLKKLVNIFPSIKNNKKNYLIEYEEFITKEITRIIIKFIDKVNIIIEK